MEDFTPTITALGDQIANLSLREASLLRDYLAWKYEIQPADRGTIVSPDPIPDPDPEPTGNEVSVILDGLAEPTKKVPVIKVVRELIGCPLAEGKAFVESAPRAIKEKITREEAEVIRKKLEEAGARVSVK